MAKSLYNATCATVRFKNTFHCSVFHLCRRTALRNHQLSMTWRRPSLLMEQLTGCRTRSSLRRPTWHLRCTRDWLVVHSTILSRTGLKSALRPTLSISPTSSRVRLRPCKKDCREQQWLLRDTLSAQRIRNLQEGMFWKRWDFWNINSRRTHQEGHGELQSRKQMEPGYNLWHPICSLHRAWLGAFPLRHWTRSSIFHPYRIVSQGLHAFQL